MRIVFECLYVGAFPIAVLLMLTPAGLPIFRSYVTGLVWLQSWGPLYAVLHRISMGEAAERMSAAALMPGGDIGISLVAQAGIRAVASDVAVMSGYLSMSVPFLAAALAYGLSKATVLATSVLAVGQDAASSAAHEGTTGNLSLASSSYDAHRFATLEGRQIRTSAHVDTDRYVGYAPAGAGFVVTGDGTAVVDASSATSRIPPPGCGSRNRSPPATRPARRRRAASRALVGGGRHGAERGRHRRDRAGGALQPRRQHRRGHARGVTESESAQVQALESHMEKLAEIGGITRNQAAVLTGEAKIGGGLEKIVKLGASGSATWRGETIESDAWNRMKEYDRQHGVTELWSRVSEASRRYSTATGESEAAAWRRASTPTSPGCGRSRSGPRWRGRSRRPGRSRRRRCARTRKESTATSPSPSSPGCRSGRARTAGRSARPGRPRISVQTAEDAETLREHAAAFIAEKFPAPAGPDPASVGGAAVYEDAAGKLRESYAGETAAAYGGWSEAVRDRAGAAGTPRPGDVPQDAIREGARTETDMIVRGSAREARTGIAREDAREGRAGVAVETDKPFEHHATENLPFIGGWLAGQLFGTARNAAPDGAGEERKTIPTPDWGNQSP